MKMEKSELPLYCSVTYGQYPTNPKWFLFHHKIEKVLWGVRRAKSGTSTTNVRKVLVSKMEHMKSQMGWDQVPSELRILS